jgi:hypothetical protein
VQCVTGSAVEELDGHLNQSARHFVVRWEITHNLGPVSEGLLSETAKAFLGFMGRSVTSSGGLAKALRHGR